MLFGGDILYKAPIAEGKANVYIGAGGGMLRASNGTSESMFLVDARGGVDYGITDKVGLFVEGKYLYAKKSGAEYLNDVGAFAGISFKLGSE
jgi:hypothetical protein